MSLLAPPLLRVGAQGTELDGLPLFRGSADHLLDEMEALVASGGHHLVMTPNVDQVLALRADPRTAAAHRAASLRIADGAPLVGLARLLGDRRIQRLTGADLLGDVVARAAVNGWRVAIVGGADGVSDEAAARLRAGAPGVRLVTVPFPFVRSVDEPGCAVVADALREARPDVVFVCLGSPKQEAWFLEWRDRLPPGVYVGAGAAVEFAAGARSRAPRAVQRLGGEWLWRLAQEPRRLAHRYLVRGPAFVGVVLGSLVDAAHGRRS
jgi:N-acetylglucosaminyldiphosphoundecaprenol N-acetyl-beta-D-mannosaminyltransferase